MKLLLINSGDKDAFAAFLNNEELFVSYASDFTKSSNAKQPDKLINCLHKVYNLYNLEDIDAVSVTIGPGSFTGTRVGLAIAKGIAYASNKKIIPVTNFSLTLNRVENISGDKRYCVLINAKLNEYYYSVIKAGTELESGCIEIEHLEKISGKDTVIVADFDNESIIKHSYLEIINVKNRKKPADSMLELTKKHFRNNHLISAQEIEPLYLKDFILKTHVS